MLLAGPAGRACDVLGISLHYADTFSQRGRFFGAQTTSRQVPYALLQSDVSGNQEYRGKRGALLKRPRHADVRRKRTIVHKADSEVNDLADLKRFNDDNIGESHRIISTIFTADDAESLIRIETLYDSLHMAPAFLR